MDARPIRLAGPMATVHAEEAPSRAPFRARDADNAGTRAGVIDYRICPAGAARRGYAPEDFHGFASVVPMADAEIIRLQQQEGYGYMR